MYNFDSKNHVHLLDGQPLMGTSTVIKEVMPPFLAKWGAECAVRWLKEKPEDWTGAVLAYTKERKEAADKGTDMHSELEKYVKKMINDQDGIPLLLNDSEEKDDKEWKKIQTFAEWAFKNVDKFLLSEAYTYSKECWVGGVVDCVARMETGELAVIDFKSSKAVYFNHIAQVAGYALQLDEMGAYTQDGAALAWKKPEESIGSLIIVPFGAPTFKPVKVTNVAGFKDTFKHIVEVYKFLTAFKDK